MGDNQNYSKQRYLDINGKEIDEDKESQMMEYRTEMLEDSQGNKIDTSYIEVKDEDIIEQVNTSDHHYEESQPVTLSQDSNGTFQIIVSNGGNNIPTTLSNMVSRMNHANGGVLLDQSGEKDDGRQQHVVVTTSSELGDGGETIVIRNLDEHSPEMQKEILNALLQHHADQQQHDGGSSTTTLRYVFDNRSNDDNELHGNDNVKVEAEPTSGGEMSPESLTAISGGHHHHQQQQQQHQKSMQSSEGHLGQ